MSVYPLGAPVTRGAVISGDGLYRFALTRHWGPDYQRDRFVTFVMLNPSTADAERDDRTIGRCVGFARRWGFDGLRVVNLYAYRATKPADLWGAGAPTGGERNDALLAELGRLIAYGEPVVAAWGAGAPDQRVAEVLALPGWDQLTALGVTKSGAPRHPLYVRGDAERIPWPDRCGDPTCAEEHGTGGVA